MKDEYPATNRYVATTNVVRQMMELAQECVEYAAVPMVLLAIDGNMKGHMFWPDELPEDIVKALPLLLEDTLDGLKEHPL
jgi:hypothetical protein